MQRLTCRMEDGSYSLSGEIQAAVERLGAFETLYETLAAEQEAIGAELAALRLAGKEKTCRARELMGKRLMNSNLLALFRLHGIS